MKIERYSFIDVAKGLLISLVIFFHTSPLAEANGIENEIFINLKRLNFLFSPFFMGAFFFITGFCSNFDKKYAHYLLKDIKTLVLPSLTLLLMGGVISWIFNFNPFYHDFNAYKLIRFISPFWFLIALFWAKQIHYFLRKVRNRWVSVLYLLLCFIGVILHNHVMDYWWIQHAFIFAIFIYCGEHLKTKTVILEKLSVCVLPYVLYIICYSVFSNRLPSITEGVDLEMWQIPFFLISAILGTLFILYICNKIKSSFVLEYLGRNSLVIYCLHFTFMSIFYITFCESINNSLEFGKSVVSLITMFIFVVTSCMLLAWFFNLKYLRCIIGKF